VDCHSLPTGENGLLIPAQLLQEDQDMVVPQLRNMYEKTRFDNAASTNVRGFGYTHDGAVDDLFSFLQFPGFTFRNDGERHDVAAFLLAFDTGTHAAVGAQWTMDASGEGLPRVQTLVAVADASRIGLIAKGRDLAGDARGWAYLGSGEWTPDRESEPSVGLPEILDLVGPGHEITFTGVPPGWEMRLGVDRDEDGYRDRDEIDAGSDPADPLSTPQTVGIAGQGTTPRLILSPLAPNPARSESRLAYVLAEPGPLTLSVHDVQGRLVRTIVDVSRHQAGGFRRLWDLRTDAGEAAPSGVYFVRLATDQERATTRVDVRR
jgi:hypothetical protein